MSDYKFELPFPPSVNVWKTPFRNRMILSKRGRAYRTEVVELMQSLGLSDENLTSKLSVSLVLNPPSLRRYDVDNFSKSLFDALTTCNFWDDDELVHKLTITKGEKVKGGNIQVEVSIL